MDFPMHDGWRTPNTYGENYASLPDLPGVYLLVLIEYGETLRYVLQTVVYAGSSDNLRQRCKYHPVKYRMLDDYPDGHCVCYFKVCDDYRVQEKRLIGQLQPRYNKQWR